MGVKQVSGSRTLVGEREERRERIIGDGEGSRGGLREGVVWWAKERASSSRAEGGPEVQCETSKEACRTIHKFGPYLLLQTLGVRRWPSSLSTGEASIRRSR